MDEYINNTDNSFPIPRLVHISYKTYDSIPKEYNAIFDSWKLTNPDWQINFHSYKDNDMIRRSKSGIYFCCET